MLTALLLMLAVQDPATDAACTNVRPAIPAALSGWSQQTPVTAGTKSGDGATLSIGQATNVSLHRGSTLTLSPAPAKAAAADSYGGTLTLSVAQAGTYRVALGGGAWIDLLLGGKAIASVAHDHGPKCSGIAKIVDFKLDAGTYVIQLSGAKSNAIAAMVVKA
ncbi:conserved hypothetical protein [Sphingomonas sp. EC-HK361]|uniref:hypothetical protein n=1 Tax=Sphingomonas sp. EC-HK361 TaxID=2038397 RepID=UPI0012523EA2|nr:hypothetical protein [Sphingomonas sp. EC-HK361]VVT08597.1 conserved hypothetical protein [Sphingomonas sp. EC-HK361]